jgi:predicted DNA-binding transcriptional regulator AlpA
MANLRTGNEVGHESKRTYEFLTPEQLAERLGVSVSWIKRHSRTTAKNLIPHIEFGRAKRYRWGSVELNSWIDQHCRNAKR